MRDRAYLKGQDNRSGKDQASDSMLRLRKRIAFLHFRSDQETSPDVMTSMLNVFLLMYMPYLIIDIPCH